MRLGSTATWRQCARATVLRLGLRECANGDITVRATGFGLAIIERATTSAVLAAVDAATSLDPRECGAGERVLANALERFRG